MPPVSLRILHPLARITVDVPVSSGYFDFKDIKHRLSIDHYLPDEFTPTFIDKNGRPINLEQVPTDFDGIITLTPPPEYIIMRLASRDGTWSSIEHLTFNPSSPRLLSEDISNLEIHGLDLTLYKNEQAIMNHAELIKMPLPDLWAMLTEVLCHGGLLFYYSSLYLSGTGDPIEVDTMSEEAKVNKALNEGDFYDPHGMLDFLLCFMEGAWRSCLVDSCILSPSIMVCQASGCGKTRLMRQLALQDKDPFYVFHLVCRYAQLNYPNLLVNALQKDWKKLVDEFVVGAKITPEQLLKEKTFPETFYQNDLLDKLSKKVVQYFIGFVTYLVEEAITEKDLAHRCRYPTSARGREKSHHLWEHLLRRRSEDISSLTTLMAKLKNPRVVMCFDEAAGLFGHGTNGDVAKDENKFIFRALRRASQEIQRLMTGVPGARVFFIFVDTNSAIGNPFHNLPEDLAQSREFDKEGSNIIYLPTYPFVITNNVHAAHFNLTVDLPILARRLQSGFERDSEAQLMLASVGRPLWRVIYEESDKNWDQLINTAVKKLGKGLRNSKSEVMFALLAMRLPVRITEKCAVYSELVAEAYAILLNVDRDPHAASVKYQAEPALVAAASDIMNGAAQKVLNHFGEQMSNLSPNGQVSAEMTTMLMALAATDSLTRHRPYLAVDVGQWLGVWLGWEQTECRAKLRSLPRLKGCLVACGQFISSQELEALHWGMIKMALLQGVGLCPITSKHLAVDFVVPFEAPGGLPGFLAVQIRSQTKPISPATKKSLLDWCRAISNPDQYRIIPVIISLSRGLGVEPSYKREVSSFPTPPASYLCNGIAKGVTYVKCPLRLVETNSWDQHYVLREFLDKNIGEAMDTQYMAWSKKAKEFGINAAGGMIPHVNNLVAEVQLPELSLTSLTVAVPTKRKKSPRGSSKKNLASSGFHKMILRKSPRHG